jgi:hypothetical protein
VTNTLAYYADEREVRGHCFMTVAFRRRDAIADVVIVVDPASAGNDFDNDNDIFGGNVIKCFQK